MFNQYITLDQMVQEGGTEQIQQELNSYSLYTRMVRLFGFTEIGVVATDNHGKECWRYSSLNNERGEITKIVPYFTNPSIIVQAEEKYLVEILHRAEWVKTHPVVAIMEYWRAFSVVQGRYRGVHHYVVRFFSHFRGVKLPYSHPSG